MSKIKICGLFRELDVDFVNEAKPDFVGFVFAPKSKRFIDFNQAEKLRKRLADGIVPVGVFVNAKIADIVSLCKNGIIDMVQLHGNEPDEYIKELKDNMDVKIIRAYKNSPLCDYVLLDSQTPGSGKSFDWASLEGVDLGNAFLAGGINAGNIEDALRFRPFAVDVSSGAELCGVKDLEKILYLVKITRTL